MQNYKKVFLGLLLIVFAVVVNISPKEAKAVPVEVVGDAPNTLQTIWMKVEKTYDKVQGIIGAELANRTVEMFLNTMAYDIATQLASGGPGGKPLFRVKSMKDTLRKAGEAAGGEFIGALTEQGFDDLGINLCNPSVSLKLSFTLSLIDSVAIPKTNSSGRPNPLCEWRNIVREWGNFEQDVQNDLIKVQVRRGPGSATSTRGFFQSLSENSELEDYLRLSAAFNNKKIEAEKALELSIEECRGFSSTEKPVTEEVIAHCRTYEALHDSVFVNSTEIEAAKIAARKEAATNRKLSDILSSAADKFTSTFTSKLLNYFVKQGTWSLFGNKDSDIYKDYRTTLIDRLRGGANLLQPRNGDIFKSFKKIDIGQLESYDYLTNIILCPDEFRNPDNCTMSPTFLQAVSAGMTLGEAIDQGVINGSMALIGPDNPINGSKDKCYKDALCYSNLIKIRKLNIIPVGWEMASTRGPATLVEAMNCFEDGGSCKFAKSSDYAIDGVDHNPFYHLIDSAWVLKAPDATCDALVYSATLESPESSNRQQYCADPKMCLREDASGNCLDGQYGYCTRSENIWRFEGQECENGEVYSGCLTFGNKDYGEASYIESTLDYCTADEAGCRRYSQEQALDGNWVLENIATDDNDLFLNRQSSSCEASEAGCSEFIVIAADRGINLVPNGSFNDTNGNGTPDGWIDEATGQESNAVEYDGNRLANGYPWGDPASPTYVPPYPGTESIYQSIFLLPNTTYRISVSASLYNVAEPTTARISILLCDNTNNCNNTSLAFPVVGGGDCEVSAGDNNPDLIIDSLPADGSIKRDSCTFTTNDAEIREAKLAVVAGSGAYAAWFDDVKVEMVSNPGLAGDATYTNYGEGGIIYTDNSRFMCLAEEVGCQGYTPANGDPMIPAVLSADDLCPAECVGYATFSEQPDIFDIIEDPSANVSYYNFIPNTATNCPAQDVGCEEFTNLEEVAQGGEGREYYTYLRQCVPENLATVYYTWEGNDVAGYQLKTWALLESNLNTSPCTNVSPGASVCTDTAGSTARCGSETADPNDDPDVDPNCREFFDTEGNAHFRFQDRVIFASNDCHDYRRTLSGQIYRAIPNLSIACAAENNNCRDYYGNTSNNVRVVFNDNFEKGTYSPWEAVSGANLDLSSESLNNNGHSLKIVKTANNTTVWRDVGNKLRNDKEYELSWWMKNNAFINSFRIRLYAESNAGTPIVSTISCGGVPTPITSTLLHNCDDPNLKNIGTGNWQKYKVSNLVDILGPNVDLSTLKIAFDINGNVGDVFMDNIILKEVTDSFAAVRNSWQTPVSCDDPYIGYHLGCQAYTDTNNFLFNIRSFSRLCREQAIGCRPAINTHNSTYPFAETFNAGDFSEITVATDTPAYLVPDVETYCSAGLKGCSALGLQSREDANQFETVYKINNPDLYNNILCNSDSLGCEEYTSSKGPYYFKDPAANTCSYQENFSLNGSKFSGWFETASLATDVPVGCTDDADATLEPEDLQFLWDYCHNPTDPSERWNYFNKHDCEANSGTWLDYGTVASCPASENLCTSFKDPASPVNCDPNIISQDISGYCSNPDHDNERDCNNGRCSDPAYRTQTTCSGASETWYPAGLWTARCDDYYYYDRQIDEASCNGQVDRNNGCILFYESNNWDAQHTETIGLYDASRTYNESSKDDMAISPISCDPTTDPSCNLNANRLIKVKKDRQCAEWLSCKSSTAVWDQDAGEYKLICDNLSSCIEYDDSGSSNSSRCKKWASYDEDLEPLTFNLYQTRASGSYDRLDWDDKEYIGYSLPGYLPVKDLFVYNFGDINNPNPRLVYGVYDTSDVYSGRRYFSDCVDSSIASRPNVNGVACSSSIADQNFYGECQAGLCMVSPKVGVTATSTFAVETRGYAMAEAPFPSAIIPTVGQRIRRYNSANICENDGAYPNGCEQSFIKATYGLGNQDYYYPEDMSLLRGICTSGDDAKNGDECFENRDCDSLDKDEKTRNDGACSLLKEIVNFNNWTGICLEYDYSTELVMDKTNSFYCNQWYPAVKISGTSSLYDNYAEAGYYDPSGGDALFCAAGEAYQVPEDRYYCLGSIRIWDSYFCTALAKVPKGTKVHADILANNSGNSKFSDTINYGYLNKSFMTPHGPTDVVTDSGRTFNGLGVYWLNRRGAAPLFSGNWDQNHRDPLPLSAGADAAGDGSSLFYAPDFDPTGTLNLANNSQLPFLPLENLNNIFDADNSTGVIELFFYDNDIDRNGYNNYAAGVVWPYAPTVYPLGMYQEYGVQKTEDRVYDNLRQCQPGFHESWYNDQLDGYWGTRGWNGHGHLEQDRWCSPMSYGIYIKPAFASGTQSRIECSEYSCGNGANNTRTCLQGAATYASILPSIAVCPTGDVNCQYVACVEGLGLPLHFTSDADLDPVNVLYCSDFGDYEMNILRVNYVCPSGQIKVEDYQDIANISGCLSVLYTSTITDIPTSKPYGTEICLTSAGQQYRRLDLKLGTSSALGAEVTQCGSSYYINNIDLNGDSIADDIPVDCSAITTASGQGWYDLSSSIGISSRLRVLRGDRYRPDTFDVMSTGADNCTDLECYQQCSIVTQLDDEGDLSWVRTDIWWRESQVGADRIVIPRWNSWYYGGTNNYVMNNDVTYDDIISQAYNLPSHYGAARRNLEDSAVLTRSPLGSVLGKFGAATFFGYYNVNTTTRASVWNYVATKLTNLFARAYNFDWDNANSEYVFNNAEQIDGLGNNRNTFAGRDYSPRALAVCGNALCENSAGGYEEGISVNDVRSGPLYGSGGSFFINVKFFFHAHPDHMPIYSIDVDWGDGLANTYNLNPGKYKNSLLDCNPAQTMPGMTGALQGFGGLSRACHEGFKVLYHDYQYDLDSAGTTHPCDGLAGRPVIANASCYKPTIRIIDRWGWANTFSFGENTASLADDWVVVYGN